MNFYTWGDQEYREFMIGLLMSLEPIYYNKHTILIDELDEQNQITFIHKGQVVVGYEINK